MTNTFNTQNSTLNILVTGGAGFIITSFNQAHQLKTVS